MPHLNQKALVCDAHPKVEEYPYDSEAYEVISKRRKRVGKPRTIEGYISGLNRFGRWICHSRWMLRKILVWANGLNYRGGISMADHICFPTEACWWPRMNVSQHIQEKTRYIAMGRSDAVYRAFVADPANATIFTNPPSGFQQRALYMSPRSPPPQATPLRASRCWMASGYSLVFGWLAFWVLWRSVRAGVDSPESSVRELPHSEGCLYTYIGTVFLILGWVFRF